MKYLFAFYCVLMMPTLVLGQKPNTPPFNIENFIEELVAIPSSDLNYNELYETLLQYYNDPLNLNIASREELASLYILSDIQINSLLEHIENTGLLLNIYEIQAIPYFDKVTISRLIHFIKVGLPTPVSSKSLTKNLLKKDNNSLLIRYEQTLEKRKGFRRLTPDSDGGFSKAYRGSSGRYNVRFRSQKSGDYKFGVSLEKDAGETFNWNFKGGNYGADSYNAYLQFFNKGRLKNFVLGDYQLQLGQGLILNGGFNLGKGAETITTVKRPNTGIRAHSSQLETGFLRGAAGTYEISNGIDATVFISRLGQDAITVSDSTVSSQPFTRAIQTSGLHRTDSEIRAKNSITQVTYGGNVSYQNPSNNFQIGTTALVNQFSIPILRESTLSNQFKFQGDFNLNLGLNINYLWENFSFFTEIVRSNGGGTGIVGGFISSLSKQVSLSFLARSYDRNFHSLFGQAFAESATANINEKGIYIGFKYEISRKYQLSGYFDQFKFPWVQTRINRPSAGYEYLIRGSYTPSKSAKFHVQLRQESKARNINDGLNITQAKQGIKNNYLISLDHQLGKNAGFKSRVQFSNYKHDNKTTKGFALIQDAHYNFGKFKLAGRVALFDTEDFENRQYVYERDVLYAFSLPAYNGVGSRKYLLLQYKFSSYLKAWVRWANTKFTDRDTISSGQQEIEGNSQNDIKLQLQFLF